MRYSSTNPFCMSANNQRKACVEYQLARNTASKAVAIQQRGEAPTVSLVIAVIRERSILLPDQSGAVGGRSAVSCRFGMDSRCSSEFILLEVARTELHMMLALRCRRLDQWHALCWFKQMVLQRPLWPQMLRQLRTWQSVMSRGYGFVS